MTKKNKTRLKRAITVHTNNSMSKWCNHGHGADWDAAVHSAYMLMALVENVLADEEVELSRKWAQELKVGA